MLESMVSDICGADILVSISKILTLNLFDENSVFGSIMGVIRPLYEGIKVFGVMLLFIYFLVSLIDKSCTENVSLEQMGRQFVMLIVAKLLIDHGFYLMESLFSFGSEATKMVDVHSFATTEMDVQALVNTFLTQSEDGLPSILKALNVSYVLVFCQLLLPWLGSWLMRLAVFVVGFSRLIEIYTRAALCPIALADFFQHGLQGAGWRFLKSFLAICLQGLTMMIIMAVFSVLFSHVPDIVRLIYGDPEGGVNLFFYIGIFLMIYASTVMLLFKSLTLTKELVGVA